MLKQTCKLSGREFIVDDDELEFLNRVSPVVGGKTLKLPAPSVSPLERERRRLAFRNLRHLYRRNCALTGRPILSCYDPELPFNVAHSDVYWSDCWDPLAHGRDFDFSRSFTEQFLELEQQVPLLHNYVILNENCEYINGAANCKDCYLAFNMDYCESCYYIFSGNTCRSCIDCYYVTKCELCYECIDCENCYNLRYAEQCISCSDSAFLRECLRCRNCIGCANLIDKEYHVFNKAVGRETFEEYRKMLSSRAAVEQLRLEVNRLFAGLPRKHYFGHSLEESTGTSVHHLKNSRDCFEASELENCFFCNYVFKARNCRDYNIFGDNSEWIYNSLAVGINCYQNICCNGVWNGSHDNQYCLNCMSISDCFGSIGLRRHSHCILNKQYAKQDYEALMHRIYEHMLETGEWGEFFAPAVSAFWYNDTLAQEEYPLGEHAARLQGYRWKAKPAEHTGAPSSLPDRIEQAAQSICSEVLSCSVSGAPFKIIRQEFSFYQTQAIPLPQLCPDVRHQRRLERRLPRRLFDRECSNCARAIRSPYAPQRPELVYCTKCYEETVS